MEIVQSILEAGADWNIQTVSRIERVYSIIVRENETVSVDILDKQLIYAIFESFELTNHLG